MDRSEGDDRPQHVNQSEPAGLADIAQARDVHGGVHFHGARPSGELPLQQLPADIRHFIDRRAELDDLDGVLSGDTGETLVVITGTAGVGKTSLALRWAHRVRRRFPDGQLYVNLKGYDPGTPMTPEQALDRFLRALGVSPAAIPADAEERAALFRSYLADRRILLVLDNAATGSQVRPLLPGTASCLVIVTSRNRLSGLVARDGGRRLTLGILPGSDAVALLKLVTADYRGGDTPEQLQELASLCARLPLALRIAAERAASRPFMPLVELIRDLRDESALWDALTAGDDEEADAVRTVFAWSYCALADDAARLFRLLGLHPGPDFDSAAGALLGRTDRIRHLLDVLVGANLLEQTGPDRYQLHDLLRAYATDQVRHLETEARRHAALRRVLNWYLHTADSALATLMPFNRTVAITEPLESAPLRFPTETAAGTWFEAERENLVAATRAAGENGLHQTAWQLAAVLRGVLMHQNAFEDWIATGRVGLAAARAAQNRYGESEVPESLGKAYFQARRLAEAEECHLATLEIRREIGNRFGEAVSTNALGLLGLRHRRLDDSVTYFGQSLAIFRELGNPRWEALLSSNLGETLYEFGHLHEAVDHLDQALAIQREIGDRAQEGNSLFFLSMAQRELGQTTEALRSIESALDIAYDEQNSVWLAHWFVAYARVLRAIGRPAEALGPLQRTAVIQRTLGDQSREAMALDCTGETYRELGQPEEAVKFHLQAAKAHRELGDLWHLAVALDHLASALADTGRPEDALRHWEEASALLTRFPDPRATAVRDRVSAALHGA
ncbi:ATP-binding protein [Allosalinactinospora lopnorensis]|uniref:ATP-binding protein n=1 Tax=Allosalinactinospora lopnorensis TaxID=1352348 RepID=UPI000623C8AB|nr:tetratricopeptide repeat protein [Allosalinactinospora lopnorensis]